jgi:class 3 adenylate cyclase
MTKLVRHRLLAVLAADAAGYSRLMAEDDLETLRALESARESFRCHVQAEDGRIVDTSGDSVLAAFDTSAGAVQADPRIENFTACKVVIEPDGRATFESKSFAKAEFSALVAQMRRSCVGRGAFGYTNLTQKANVTLDLIDFLDSNFAQ